MPLLLYITPHSPPKVVVCKEDILSSLRRALYYSWTKIAHMLDVSRQTLCGTECNEKLHFDALITFRSLLLYTVSLSSYLLNQTSYLLNSTSYLVNQMSNLVNMKRGTPYIEGERGIFEKVMREKM